MADQAGPLVYTIPPHRAFSDALVAGILAQHGADGVALARGTIIVPNNRAGQAIRDAFVRQASSGLLIPRLVAIGDAELNERAGLALDPADADPIPPAIDPLHRQLMLARLVQDQRPDAVDAAEAMRLAGDLARTLDQLLIEERTATDLRAIELEGALAKHWQTSLDQLTVIMDQWPAHLAALGCVDLADRRNRMINRLADRWAESPPEEFVIAAGISTGAPAIARLMRRVARLPKGQVVLAGLDLTLSADDWALVGGSDTDAPLESHPQFHLRQLLDGMRVARDDVKTWRWGSDADARSERTRAISHAFVPPDSTRTWINLPPAQRNLSGVTALTFPTIADEAQGIAIALRGALEVPGQTAALVTPDRNLAARVSAHLERWGIKADDSAGQPLTASPQGGFILALVDAAVQKFAPVPLLALVKHPLVRLGEGRLAWLDGARALDLALRGPRPGGGLDGITRFLAGGDERQQKIRQRAQGWWAEAATLLAPLEMAFTGTSQTLGTFLAALREMAEALAGEGAWSGEAGRALSDMFSRLESNAESGPQNVSPACLPPLLRHVLDGVPVRPGYGGHPRLFIWGLLEAKLQSAHFMVLGGLNEGVWPQLPSPDPWLAPSIRKALKLPGLERRIGLSAHDLASALGAPQVLLTRARRDARSPTNASRFWLRLDTMTGGLAEPAIPYDRLATHLDRYEGRPQRERRPELSPPVEDRPRVINVTDVDTLKADPYSFYARAMLGLSELDPVDAEPSPAWRGSMIHAVLEDWAKEDDYRPGLLAKRMEAALSDGTFHPLIRALWLPRLAEAAEWIEARVAEGRAEGRNPVKAEVRGEIERHGVTIKGRADRIDRMPDGSLGVIDYKTGAPPSNRQVGEGYAPQLGLIGLIAEGNGFDGVNGTAGAFEYWSLARDSNRSFGKVASPVTGKSAICVPEDFVAKMDHEFRDAVETWLTGAAPFRAKIKPEYSYAGYDHLMRLEEWEGRDG